MSRNFIGNVQKTLNNEFNFARTENGALGFRTTGKNLLDLNFQVASLRSASEADIIQRFMKSFYEDPMVAMKWLFYARDVRGGLGERRLFRTVMSYLIQDVPAVAKAIVKLIPEYGRFDDWMVFIGTPLFDDMMVVIEDQLKKDLANFKAGASISLLCKWLPSINTSSEASRAKAKVIAQALGMSEKRYRKTLSSLRAYIKVVEVDMSAGNWGEIDYEKVPSKANLLYKGAFKKHDVKRREQFLEAVAKGDAKINAGVLYPHDIVEKYMANLGGSYQHYSIKSPVDPTVEALWKALPNLVKGDDSTIVVADGSGSMISNRIGDSSIMALTVANALAIYFAERCGGEFKDKYITFSERPQLVDLSNGQTLKDKLNIAMLHDEVANTNIEAVFDLILQTAKNGNLEQSELPKNILIISDMEFDSAQSYRNPLNERLFETIARKYTIAGYKLPRLVFWNVNSRTKTIPVIENALGIALVSGFSPNIVKMVMSNQTDPYAALLEQLNVERYEPIAQALENILR